MLTGSIRLARAETLTVYSEQTDITATAGQGAELPHTSAYSWSSSYGWQGCWEKPVEENLTKLPLSVSEQWLEVGRVTRSSVVESQPTVMRSISQLRRCIDFFVERTFHSVLYNAAFFQNGNSRRHSVVGQYPCSVWLPHTSLHSLSWPQIWGHTDPEIPTLIPNISLYFFEPQILPYLPRFMWPVLFPTNQDLP